MKALEKSSDLDSLRNGFAKEGFSQLAPGRAVFIQAYGQTAGQRSVGNWSYSGVRDPVSSSMSGQLPSRRGPIWNRFGLDSVEMLN